MYDVAFVVNTRSGDQFGRAFWLPMLPSFQFPTIEWEPGRVETVETVTFPDAPDPILITLRGEVLDADRASYLDRGWRVLPVRPSADPPNPGKA